MAWGSQEMLGCRVWRGSEEEGCPPRWTKTVWRDCFRIPMLLQLLSHTSSRDNLFPQDELYGTNTGLPPGGGDMVYIIRGLESPKKWCGAECPMFRRH